MQGLENDWCGVHQHATQAVVLKLTWGTISWVWNKKRVLQLPPCTKYLLSYFSVTAVTHLTALSLREDTGLSFFCLVFSLLSHLSNASDIYIKEIFFVLESRPLSVLSRFFWVHRKFAPSGTLEAELKFICKLCNFNST